MKNRFLELMSWEVRDNWAFPILEIIIALVIVQTLSYTTLHHEYHGGPYNREFSRVFFTKPFFVLILSAAIVFGRSFGESIEKRKLIVLLSYPVSRTRLFLAKYLTNFLMIFLIFGLALLVEGITLFLFDGVIPPAAWSFAFLYLSLEVFFTGALMTFFTLATKRFGISILIFLVYMFGLQAWIPPGAGPISSIRLDVATSRSVDYLQSWYFNTLGLGIHGTGDWTDAHFVTALAYMLGVGFVLFLASFFIMRKMDLD